MIKTEKNKGAAWCRKHVTQRRADRCHRSVKPTTQYMVWHYVMHHQVITSSNETFSKRADWCGNCALSRRTWMKINSQIRSIHLACCLTFAQLNNQIFSLFRYSEQPFIMPQIPIRRYMNLIDVMYHTQKKAQTFQLYTKMILLCHRQCILVRIYCQTDRT